MLFLPSRAVGALLLVYLILQPSSHPLAQLLFFATEKGECPAGRSAQSTL